MAKASAQPMVSVILPVFNAERYLEAALVSILNQTFEGFEVLLLDDGSSDGSLAILRSFERRDARCIVHTRENRGLVKTLNEGLSRARGEVVMRMDADDRCHPRRFEQQLAYLKEHPECVAVGSDVLLIDPKGHPLRKFGMPCTHEEIDGQHMQGTGSMIVHPSVAMRRAAVLEVGGYREEFRHAEDFDLFLRMAEIGRLVNLPDMLLDYRQHLGSIGHQFTSQQLESKRKAVIAARLRRGLIGHQPNLTATSYDASPVEAYRRWAWWALGAGNVSTARKHAWKAILYAPFSIKSLRVMACVLRGY